MAHPFCLAGDARAGSSAGTGLCPPGSDLPVFSCVIHSTYLALKGRPKSLLCGLCLYYVGTHYIGTWTLWKSSCACMTPKRAAVE